jgi:hypothetical protein
MRTRGVISIGRQTSFSYHRSGWAYAIEALREEHDDNGVFFDGFLDRTFNRLQNPAFERDLPLRRPWTGFFHNPFGFPDWFREGPMIASMIQSRQFRESLEYCVGLLTVSGELARNLRAEVDVPVSALIHPTEIPETLFDFEAFLSNPEKKIISIGWWLRRTLSIYYLPLDRTSPYRKARLKLGDPFTETTRRGLARIEFVKEWSNRRLEQRFKDNTQELPYLPNLEFDGLLSNNLVYLDLFAAGANNAVVECIARGTPLLVNPLPAVVEYLGQDYPLYFNTLEEAASKACDFDLVERAHLHLIEGPTRKRLSQKSFLQDFRQSEVYERLRLTVSR